jgi:aromatic ring hydroxylase
LQQQAVKEIDMMSPTKTISLPPHIGAFLSQVAETADFETALLKVLTDYVDLKTHFLKQRIQTYELKWDMTFAEFSKRIETKTLHVDPYAYEVKSDFWEWEQTETLLKHYETLQTQF